MQIFPQQFSLPQLESAHLENLSRALCLLIWAGARLPELDCHPENTIYSLELHLNFPKLMSSFSWLPALIFHTRSQVDS